MLLLKHTATRRHERTRARSDRADKHAQPETQGIPTVEVQRLSLHLFPVLFVQNLARELRSASLCLALLTQLLAWSGKCTFQCSTKCTNHCKIWWTAEACRVLRRDFRWVTSVLPKRMNCCFRLFRLSNMLT